MQSTRWSGQTLRSSASLPLTSESLMACRASSRGISRRAPVKVTNHRHSDLDAAEYDDGRTGPWTRGLLIRRNIADGDLAFFSTWCPDGTTAEVLVKVEGHRWAIEDSFEPTTEPKVRMSRCGDESGSS